MEEAQYYLGSRNGMREDSPFVRWFKEGRKYQLGSVLVTQQPGAVGAELISQCDNFFVFHLLSSIDLDELGRANLHYSPDILPTLASEPMPGNCYLWSGRGMSMVTCARILGFRDLVEESRATASGERPEIRERETVLPGRNGNAQKSPRPQSDVPTEGSTVRHDPRPTTPGRKSSALLRPGAPPPYLMANDCAVAETSGPGVHEPEQIQGPEQVLPETAADIDRAVQDILRRLLLKNRPIPSFRPRANPEQRVWFHRPGSGRTGWREEGGDQGRGG